MSLKKRILALLIGLTIASTTAACGGDAQISSPPTATPAIAIATATQKASATATAATAASTVAASVTDALTQKSKSHEDANDYVWDSSAVVSIALNGNSITTNGSGVKVDGSRATITSAGTYKLSGSLANGQIVVDTADKQVVRLILSRVDLRNSATAPIYIASAKKTVIVLADNTENIVADGASYSFENPAEDEPNAAIFSKGDLTIYGNGSLTVNGNYNDGIASKDGLLIVANGNLTVNAADDGIRGKDYLVVKNGNITIKAGGDGLTSDDEKDAAKGYISIETGAIKITSGGDALQAQTDVMIAGGTFTLSSGGGSKARIDENTSAKGIKATVNLVVEGGTFNIDSADDALHSNKSLTINGGTFSVATGDDGMHADSTLTINGGDIRIPRSYEGLESAVITINAGNIHIVSSDDGINVAGGNDGSGMMNPGMGRGGRPMPGGAPNQDAFTYSGNCYLYIHGGYTVVDANGDGFDINGAIAMTDGVVIVNGPTQQMNGALDYDAGFKMTGGFIVAAGSSGMAQAPGAYSSRYSVLIYLNATQPAGALVHIQDSAGKDILTFAPTKVYQSIAFSSPDLVKGATYDIYIGGRSSGAVTDSLYKGGTYTPGARYTSFAVSNMVTTVGSGGNRR